MTINWQRSVCVGVLVGGFGCAGTDELTLEEQAPETIFGAVTCDPTMSVFPVGDQHNIGYDKSCDDGTCDISCPDQRANSDWDSVDHQGIDIFAYLGAPLVAVADGTVVKVGWSSPTSGLRVRLRDACGWEYYYGHLQGAAVKEGDTVKAGDLIGTMGNSGTGGVHTHFNVSPNGGYKNDIDPIDLLVATSGTACGGAPPEPEPDPGDSEGSTLEYPYGCGVLPADSILFHQQAVPSCDGRFDFVMQSDGNLVLYQKDAGAIWSSETNGRGGALVALHQGGLTITDDKWGPIWNADTGGVLGAQLAVQDDGNVVVYAPDGTALWHTNTWGR